MSDEMPPPDPVDVCIRCGCTDDNACSGGCTWASLEPPICSACVKEGEVLENPLPLPTREEMMGQLFEMGAACELASIQISDLDRQLQAAVNLLVVLVNREGGSVRLLKSEFEVIHDMRIDSRHDEGTDTQILEVKKIDPDTGEPVSSLIIPGRLPLIGL